MTRFDDILTFVKVPQFESIARAAGSLDMPTSP
jgi:hypothetical protein